MPETEPLKIYIGFDERETVAWHVLANSILTKASIPVAFIPLNLQNLQKIPFQKIDKQASNAFSYSRFLVPSLCNFEGNAIFMDCDMLITCDIAEIMDNFKVNDKAVHVVKHEYTSKVTEKYLGNKQENYPRKNWSSFVLWNCSHPKNKALTAEYIREATPAHLHRFHWLDDAEIGELDRTWNWLVTEYNTTELKNTPNNIHWTLGGPYFNEYRETDFANEWREQLQKTLRVDQHE